MHIRTIGWAKMHEVFKSLLPRYFLKDIYVKWSQFEFQTIFSKFHYSPRRLKFLCSNIVLAKFRLKMIFEFFLIKVSQKLSLNQFSIYWDPLDSLKKIWGLWANPLYGSRGPVLGLWAPRGNSEILKKWSEIQTVIISHIYLSKRFEDFMHFGPP